MAGGSDAHTAPSDPGGAPSSGDPVTSALNATHTYSLHASGVDAVIDAAVDRSVSSKVLTPFVPFTPREPFTLFCSGLNDENEAPSAKNASVVSLPSDVPENPRRRRCAAAADKGNATNPWKHPASASSAIVADRFPAAGTSKSDTRASAVLVSATSTSRASRAA